MKTKAFFIVTGITASLLGTMTAVSAPGTGIVADPVIGINDPIIGSKHDFTGLNQRAGVRAMAGVAFSDYGNPCVYCHLPPNESDTDTEAYGGIDGWNRFSPTTDHYQLYQSSSIDARIQSPNSVSLLCLSCHDGTMAMDMILFKPAQFRSKEDASLHMKMNGANEITSCGKCHDGNIAHDISPKVIGTELIDDHPISLEYGGLNWRDRDFKLPQQAVGFNNGVRLYNGNVECASCHDIHNSTNDLLLTVQRDILCDTCHTK